MILNSYLEKIGFAPKEVQVYLALLELGSQPASVVARKIDIPKATVLFLFGRLVQKGFVARAQRGRVQYFFADPQDLVTHKTQELSEQKDALAKVLPLLEEFKHPFTSQPKVLFYEGIESCKKAYRLLLTSKTPILEFATHDDLIEKFGQKFMNDFIKDRVKKGILLSAICSDLRRSRILAKRNKAHLREILFFKNALGRFYSSIAVFDQKVLILNLYTDAFAIVLESPEVAETLRTVYRLITHR